MANREAAPTLWRRVRHAVTVRRLLAYVLMPLLLLCAFASLIALNLLLRDLWGELAYAILVTGVALWALSQTRPVRRLLVGLGVRPFTVRRAILWATFALVALPGPRVLVEGRQLDDLAPPRAQPVLPEPGVLEEHPERLQRAQHQPVASVAPAISAIRPARWGGMTLATSGV